MLIVDDKFPTLGHPEATESDRGRSLWQACVQSGWMCDIDNASGLSDPIWLERLNAPDLLFLDYELIPGDAGPCLGALRHLAGTPRSSLVVVYTHLRPLTKVKQTIALHLRGMRDVEKLLQRPIPRLNEHWESLRIGSGLRTMENFEAFLAGRKEGWLTDRLRAELQGRGIPQAVQGALAEVRAELYLQEKLQVKTDRLEKVGDVTSVKLSAVGSPSTWMQAGNLFVILVAKITDLEGAEEARQVLDQVVPALVDWRQPVLHTCMAFARQAPFAAWPARSDALSLPRPELHTGWLYHLFSEQDPAGREGHLRRLVEAIADGLLSQVEAELVEFMLEGLNGLPGEETPLDCAMRCASAKVEDTAVLHALNSFLCSQPFNLHHVRTGTVFKRSEGAEEEVVWVCVSPACDMVPRKPSASNPWHLDLDPIRPMLALRGRFLRSHWIVAAWKRPREVGLFSFTWMASRLPARSPMRASALRLLRSSWSATVLGSQISASARYAS